jgi:hypothetical protein
MARKDYNIEFRLQQPFVTSIGRLVDFACPSERLGSRFGEGRRGRLTRDTQREAFAMLAGSRRRRRSWELAMRDGERKDGQVFKVKKRRAKNKQDSPYAGTAAVEAGEKAPFRSNAPGKRRRGRQR